MKNQARSLIWHASCIASGTAAIVVAGVALASAGAGLVPLHGAVQAPPPAHVQDLLARCDIEWWQLFLLSCLSLKPSCVCGIMQVVCIIAGLFFFSPILSSTCEKAFIPMYSLFFLFAMHTLFLWFFPPQREAAFVVPARMCF
jgi:hypothetical protein